MSQEPWNEEIYEAEGNSRRSRAGKGSANTRFFTILAIIFLIIVVVITAIGLYLSSGGSKTDSSQEFFNASNASAVSASQSTSSSTTTSSSSSTNEEAEQETTPSASTTRAVDGATIEVLAGEGEAAIAQRAGISIAELERLNPDKLTGPGGTWWANPGDIVKIK